MLIYLMFILINPSTVQCLTCAEVQDMPLKKHLSFQELTSMSPKDVNDCLAHLAKEPLKIGDSHFIWTTLVDFYEGISNIPENILAHLHWITPVITSVEYENITFASIDIVRNFGFYYNLDYNQLEAIAERVREDFAGKTPEDYTYYDLKALNQILCAFNRSEIERIHPKAYRESASFIGNLKNCQSDVMTGFAFLAVHKDAFGPIQNWTGLILKTVGNVAQYIPGGFPKELIDKLEADINKIREFADSEGDDVQ